jgi:hypothetical protein
MKLFHRGGSRLSEALVGKKHVIRAWGNPLLKISLNKIRGSCILDTEQE